MSSIFTKIICREIPANIEYEDDSVIVIHDINPQAKIHLLIIPKKEIPTINDLENSDSEIIGNMFLVARDVAKKLGISEGYQLKFHVGAQGGQEVFHIHLHLTSDL